MTSWSPILFLLPTGGGQRRSNLAAAALSLVLSSSLRGGGSAVGGGSTAGLGVQCFSTATSSSSPHSTTSISRTTTTTSNFAVGNNKRTATSARTTFLKTTTTSACSDGVQRVGVASANASTQAKTACVPSHRGSRAVSGGAGWTSTRGASSLSSSKLFMSTTSAEEQATSTTTTTAATASATNSMTPVAKLEALRKRMRECNLDVYLVPTDDPHLSEYTPDAYKRRGFLTGFDGSAGTAVVTHDAAYLWTDSRYWNQASMELDPDCWTLQKAGLPTTKPITKFLAELSASKYRSQWVEKKETENKGKAIEPLVVGMDPYVHSASFAKDLETAFDDAATKLAADLEEEAAADDDDSILFKTGIIDTKNENLIDPIWGDERPEIPASPFRVHPIEYAGVTVKNKVNKIRKEMKKKKASLAVFCTLDDVAYLLNLRSKGDIDTCPVGIAYATVGADEITLYCDSRKVENPNVREHLGSVVVKPYDQVVPDIAKHCETSGNKVWLDKSHANCALAYVIPENCLVDAQNAITPMKACKNRAEMDGMRLAHVQDGAAMAKFMSWLEHVIVNEGRSVSEVEIDEVLTAYRAEQPGFLEVSFPTIAGVGSNGAIVHYRAQEGTELLKHLDAKNPILIDSGGQYAFGTTDVTRTWHFGTPSPTFVDCFTRVLKGNIGVDQMVFPENTPGFVLDVFARRWLWDDGKDYGHGTGHGVGAALNVHEGPQSISPRWTNKEVLKKGMILSNEPGYYEDGNFGIRIENLLEVKYVKPEDNDAADGGMNADEDEDDDGGKGKETKKKTPPPKKFMKFARLTMIPIQKNLINVDLMTTEELDWLDGYHSEVYERVSPLLEHETAALTWLKKSCDKIDRNTH